MHKFFDLGMSDPLTLGMASPLADRIEILARKRPVTRLSRTLAGSVLLLGAALSAPLTIADAHPEPDVEKRSVMIFSDGATWSTDGETKLKSGGAYEIITEDGEVSAYQISNGGRTKKRVDIEMTDSDSYRLTLKDGEVIFFDKPDLSGLEGLKKVEGLRGLEGLKGLEGLQGLEGLKGLEKLKGLEGLSELSQLSQLEGLSALSEMDFPDLENIENIKIIVDGEAINFSGKDESKNSLRDRIQRAMKSDETVRSIRIVKKNDGDSSSWFEREGNSGSTEWVEGQLPDTVISFGDEGIRVKRSLDSAKRQLAQTEKQLERLSNDGDTSRDLEKALRDIAKAKRSLEKAQEDLEDRN